MIGFARKTARPDLPLRQDAAGRFLPWACALMVYVAALGGVGLVVLRETLHAAEAVAATLTLQLSAETSKARIETVLALLRQTPGIASANLLTPAETVRLIEPWLGPAVKLDELPAPQLVDVRLDPTGTTDIGALRQHLASVAPEARLDDRQPWLRDVRASAQRIADILAAAVVIALLLIVQSSIFASRTWLTVNRSAIELLLLLGAADRDIVRPMAIRLLWFGLSGGAIGAGAALLTILALGDFGFLLAPPAPGALAGIADWRVWAALAGAAGAAGLIALASGYVSIWRKCRV